ncbi:MAG: caspase family protein, partial [Proteobacteria bacterium]|nr:caspase family protein [Pseudomonadota bacterium]
MFRVIAAVACLITAPALAEETSSRRALLIGVSGYGYDDGWSNLHSGRDIELLAAALQSLDFAAVTVLANTDATRGGIVAGIESLIDASQPGDHVLLHYSGHGQQIVDDNG